MANDDRKTLAKLKSICIHFRNLRDEDPDSKHFERCYEKAQRAVQAKEREVFCHIKEPEDKC